MRATLRAAKEQLDQDSSLTNCRGSLVMPADSEQDDAALAARYERSFRSLLWRLRPRRLENHIERMMDIAHRANLPHEVALMGVHHALRQRIIARLVRQHEASRGRTRALGAQAAVGVRSQRRRVLEKSLPAAPVNGSPDFHCDCGLGGLARWLRAAGYDARFWLQIDDDELIASTLRSNAVLLTTDGPLMMRNAVAWGLIPALLVPLSVGKHEQYDYVMRTLCLPRKASRCMACGGALSSVAKELVRERIPPRTYPWCHDYYLCSRCGKLFWHGTHWQRVEKRLNSPLARCPGDGNRASNS